MPSDYAGPIFIVDIDETLRVNQIAGSLDILCAVQDLGVPILYLTVAHSTRRNANRVLLHNFPAGTLVDRDVHDSRCNADFKTSVIFAVRDHYPHAVLVCMGDHETHNAMQCGGSFDGDDENRSLTQLNRIDCNAPTKETILHVLSGFIKKQTPPFEWKPLALQEIPVGIHGPRKHFLFDLCGCR